MKTGPADYALIAVAVIQAVMIALWATAVHASWWLAFIPGYAVAAVVLVFVWAYLRVSRLVRVHDEQARLNPGIKSLT